MADPKNTFKLDSHTELALSNHIRDKASRGRLSLSEGNMLVLSPASEDPDECSLFRAVKEKLTLLGIDTDLGGVRALQVDVAGRPLNLTLVPRWEMPASDAKGIGGPSITLKISYTW